jgi:hypothetical protein
MSLSSSLGITLSSSPLPEEDAKRLKEGKDDASSPAGSKLRIRGGRRLMGSDSRTESSRTCTRFSYFVPFSLNSCFPEKSI